MRRSFEPEAEGAVHVDGLDAPTMEVVLLKGDGGELARLIVGKREADRAYVRTGAGPTIYAVDPGALGPAPKVPDDLKG